MIRSLGKITVATAGTPVTLAQNATNQSPNRCHSFLVQVLSTNLGKIYIGQRGMNKTTLAGVFAVLAVPTANILQSFSATLSYAPNDFTASGIYIDADNSGEGVIASVIVG